jgi:hypothetical protein
MDNPDIIQQLNLLEAEMLKKLTLNECQKIVNGAPTSSVESYFSYLLRYAPKQQFYSFAGQKAREFCAMMDWNISHIDEISEEFGKGFWGELWHRLQWRDRAIKTYRTHGSKKSKKRKRAVESGK